MIVGMTVVAFATSMPELMVSLSAAIKGSSDIAAGNIIGSNIANIGLILGSSALLVSIPVAKSTLTREVPFMIFASGLLYFLCLDGQLDFFNGLILFCCLLIFLVYCLLSVRKHAALRLAEGKAGATGTVQTRDFLRISGGSLALDLEPS